MVKNGYRERLSLQQFFLILMLAIIALFCIVLLRDDIFNNEGSSLIQHLKSGGQRDMKTETAYDFGKIQARNTERKNYLNQQCTSSALNLKTSERYMHGNINRNLLRALMSPDKSILYCRVSKAGSTYIMRKLRDCFHCDTTCLVNSSKMIRILPYEEKKLDIQDAYKFMFVREPYGRLFSTYSNKFYFPKGFWYPLGTDIIKRYRKNPSKNSLLYGHDVTFPEFIRYTVEEFEKGNHMDDHIRPIVSNCNPCLYNFDFIGKLETLNSDLHYLNHEWNTRNITNKTCIDNFNVIDSFSAIQYVNLTLKKVNGSDIKIYNLYQRTWRYYQITGVISKQIRMPFSEDMTTNLDVFKQELELARQKSLLDATAVKAQKQEAMLQAYLAIPLRYLRRLRNVVKEDCLLFGYDASPFWLFDRNTTREISSDFNYFIGIA